MASRRRPFMSSFKKPPLASFEDLTAVANFDSQHHLANPSNKRSSFASIGNLQSMNSIEDSLPEIFDQHHSANHSNRGSSSALISNLQSLNSIDNSLPKNFDKAKPKASHFRHAPIQTFQKLCQLFEKDRATRSLAVGPKEKRLRWARQQILLDDENTNQTEPLLGNFHGIGTQDDQTAQVSCSSNSKKRKNKSGDTLSEEIRSIKEGLDVVAAALDHVNLRHYTNGQLFEEIEKVSGMSDASRMKVYQVLAKEVSDARAYLECPIEYRGLWLSVKFGSSIFDA